MTLANEAQQLLREGRLAEAERLFERVLDERPDDVEALNVVGLSALRSGQLSRAKTLFERATSTHLDHPISHHHLGIAHAAAGDLKAAVAAQRDAIRLASDFYTARLQLAQALEQLGEIDQAAGEYLRALRDAQQRGRWLNADTTPAHLRASIEHAVLMVRQHRRAMFMRIVEPLEKEYGSTSLQRVLKCLSIYLKEEEAVYPDARQAPTLLYFPDLPTTAYFDRSLFSWLSDFEAATRAIRAELEDLLSSNARSERVFRNEELERLNLQGEDRPPSWNGYYFYRYGVRRDDNCRQCPETIRALDALPLCRVEGQAPEVLFSVFTAGTHLLPHRGVTNTRLVGHLPLIVPNDCALRVGGEIHEWKEGQVVVFDDTYEHEAWNRSAKTRVVLIFDIWNPYLTGVEQLAIAEITRVLGEAQKAVGSA